MNLHKEFRNPSKDFRSAPFWSWNDNLSKPELIRQAKDMKAHGMGGFFMHSREGLETEYLSPEWMDCIKAAVAQARRSRMNAWLYDEDRWPSGFAGGLVTEQSDKYKAKGLTIEIVKDIFRPDAGVLRCFITRIDKNKLYTLKDVSDAPLVRPGRSEVVLVFRLEISNTSNWYNKTAYSDNLDPATVQAFIDNTYEAYKNKVGKEFGKTIPGMFTDEPNIAGFIPRKSQISNPKSQIAQWIPWTDIFADFFSQRRGYDILAKIPHFFFDGSESVKIRHDYWKTIAELFAYSYSRQLGQWCGRNKIMYTGHYLLEDELFEQIAYGGAVMPQYEYQHLPGIDILCEQVIETLTVKQTASVAHQFNRPRLVSELYGVTGWDFSFEGQKWVGDWQYALGVNLRCQHLTLYTLRGCRKRDYPPSFNYQNTWWKYNKVMEDYFGRLSLVLSQGEPVRDILVIHPIASAWAVHDFKHRAKVDAVEKEFRTLAETLLALHRDYDFGDEILMSKYGRVKGRQLVINKAAYQMVIIPPCLTLSSSTMKLLKEYLNTGGKIIAVWPLPTLIDALPAKSISQIFRHKNIRLINRMSELESAIAESLPRQISIQDKTGQESPRIIYMERRVGNRRFFFIVNTDREAGYDVQVRISGTGAIEEWNPLTGDIKPLASVVVDNRPLLQIKQTQFPVQIGPAGSRLYRFTPGKTKAIKPKPTMKETDAEFLGPVWQFKRLDYNSLPLDFCEYRLNGSIFSKPMQTWQAQRDIRRKLGLDSIDLNGGCQRWKWLKDKKQLDRSDVTLKIRFRVREIPKKPTYLILEGSKHFSITLNNQRISNRPSGWWIDRNFHKIKLPRLKKGENIILLSCKYRDEMELEDCYLAGDFGINIDTQEITTEPQTLHTGNWCTQGYPFYSGSMAYQSSANIKLDKTEKIFLKLGKFEASVIKVSINGKEAGFVPWPDADNLEITRYLRNGQNRIEIEVVGTPRNLLGPLHHKPGKPLWTGSSQFRTEGARFTPDYLLVPYGLMGQVKIERRTSN